MNILLDIMHGTAKSIKKMKQIDKEILRWIMGLFDKLKRGKSNLTMDAIISEEYEQQYFDECKYIWKNYVPQAGQADNLQGELLREIEKIRCEAQDNGNINWDDDYSYFCDFISRKLTEQPVFSETEKQEINLIMAYIKECGTYAKKFYSGKISENSVDMEKLAYVNDNLYDRICDKIGRLHKENGEPMPYEKNDNIARWFQDLRADDL